MSLSISDIILLCALQTFGLLIILLQKKFKSPPNNILKVILASLLVYYAYYYFYFENITKPFYLPFFLCFAMLSPLIIYMYCMTVINGKIPGFRAMYIHLFLPFTSLVWSYSVWQFGSSVLQAATLKLLFIVLGLLHFIYPLFIILHLAKIYQLSGTGIFSVFRYNREKTTMLRLFVIMMLIHSVMLNIKSVLFISGSDSWHFLEITNIVFLLVLSYLIGYFIITTPTGVHLSRKRLGITGFKNYNKSGLSYDKAQAIAEKLNTLCQNEKVYLDPAMNLKKISVAINESPHHVTETLNRLVGQNVCDYLNNFRVEEFKRMIQDPAYRNYSILALAFEVGFNSKATFNTAFKQFTGQTPSEYKASVLTKSTPAK